MGRSAARSISITSSYSASGSASYTTGGALEAALHIFHGHVVHREDAVLRAGFDRHVRDAETVVNGKAGNARAGEFQRAVKRAVHPDHAD